MARLTDENAESFVQRRRGATYQDGYRTAKDRLARLKEEIAGDANSPFSAYVVVAVCTCIEAHLKYSFAHIAERFVTKKEALSKLLKGANVTVDQLIAIQAKNFTLADVVASSISVSSLDGYLKRASDLFSAFNKTVINFPWSYQELFTENDPALAKEIERKLYHLRSGFAARHRLVHEVEFALNSAQEAINPSLLVDDALWLLGQFEQQYWELELNPEIGGGVEIIGPELLDRHEKILDSYFAKLESIISERRRQALENFRSSFNEYLKSRGVFIASVFLAQQSEEAANQFVQAAKQYEPELRRIVLEQEFLIARYPEDQQLKDIVGDSEK